MKKKLQVFVSSTYTDLIEERQAAVQAVLDAGHIPAGMELFKAGNESQLKTICKWIDECDVYMLILGGRYGTIESKSGKSYTHVEYDYAVSKGRPVFAVVLNQDFLTKKIMAIGLDKVTELQNPDKYKNFKEYVMTKIIREVEDCKDIKLAVHTTLNEFINDYDLTGWVRGGSGQEFESLIKENKELYKENSKLIKQIESLNDQINSKSKTSIGEYDFNDLVEVFTKKIFAVPGDLLPDKNPADVNAYKLFTGYYNYLCAGISNDYSMSAENKFIFYKCCPYYMGFGLLEKIKLPNSVQRIQISKLGLKFYSLIQLNNKNDKAKII